MTNDLLKEVNPGDQLSASQQNLLIRAAKDADSGPEVFRSGLGAQHRKHTSPREVFAAKLTAGNGTAGYDWEETIYDKFGLPSTKQGGRNSTDLKKAYENNDADVTTPIYVDMLESTDKDGLPYWGFQWSPGGALDIIDCATVVSPGITGLQFRGGFSLSDPAANQKAVTLNIVADPTCAGIVITYDPSSCQPMKIGNSGVSDVKYVGGVLYQTKCGVDSIVFSTTSCPSSPGVSPGEFFAFQP